MMPAMRILTAADAIRLLEPCFAGREVEVVAVVYLDARNHVVRLDTHDGSRDHADLPLGGILGEALRLKTPSLLLAHNHPSGGAWASRGDVNATRRLVEVAAAVRVRLLDHLVFARGACCSMRREGLL